MSSKQGEDKARIESGALNRRKDPARRLYACGGIRASVRAPRQRGTGAGATARPPSGKRPKILVIFGDDVGVANISAYSNGVMGYETPNIDRIGREASSSSITTGEQSCTRAVRRFLTGQHGIRTGLTKVASPARRWA